MKKNKNKAFTLIELIIVITIIVLLLTISYAPYNYYQNKAKLKIATREVSQTLYDARNMAISGVKDSSTNRSIGVYFTTENIGKEYIKIFSYPLNINKDNLNLIDGTVGKEQNIRPLQDGVYIKKLENYGSIIFYFDAITGNTTVYSWDGFTNRKLSDDEIDILIGFKGSESASMQKTIKYLTKTNIVDYK